MKTYYEDLEVRKRQRRRFEGVPPTQFGNSSDQNLENIAAAGEFKIIGEGLRVLGN
jgi:hypothetical protein